MGRARKIAAIIVGDVWPGVFTDSWTYRKIENAVERHMLRPHQVKDHVGIIWEQMSDGCYRTLNGAKTDYIDRNFGPLTTIQGEPMPDAGEIERLKDRIAELEKRSKELVLSSAEVRGVCGKQKERIAELENQIATLQKEIIEWKQSCFDKRDIIDTWAAVASMCDVPKWDGEEYSDDRTWAKRVFATIEKMMEAKK